MDTRDYLGVAMAKLGSIGNLFFGRGIGNNFSFQFHSTKRCVHEVVPQELTRYRESGIEAIYPTVIPGEVLYHVARLKYFPPRPFGIIVCSFRI